MSRRFKRTVMRWPLCTVSVVFIQVIKTVPLCELAPPPPPFMFAPRAPLPSLSRQAKRSGSESWGGSRLTVFRMSAVSECAKHVSKSRESDECRACMSVRVSECAGTILGESGCPLDFEDAPNASSLSDSEPLISAPAPFKADNLCPRLSSARSVSRAPSTWRAARSSRAWSCPSSTPECMANVEGSA